MNSKNELLIFKITWANPIKNRHVDNVKQPPAINKNKLKFNNFYITKNLKFNQHKKE